MTARAAPPAIHEGGVRRELAELGDVPDLERRRAGGGCVAEAREPGGDVAGGGRSDHHVVVGRQPVRRPRTQGTAEHGREYGRGHLAAAMLAGAGLIDDHDGGEPGVGHGRHAAEDALMDRTVFAVNSKAYAEYMARLDAPPRPNARLRRSLQTTAPWEK